jgi:ferredoxin
MMKGNPKPCLWHDLLVPELGKVENISSNILVHYNYHFMTQIYTVEIHHQGEVHTIEVPEDKQILRAAGAAGIYLPTSCNAGVCTTCAAQILDGKVEQGEGMGVSPELQEQGYALLCVAYPRSNLKIATEKEDEVYELQFGQHQR